LKTFPGATHRNDLGVCGGVVAKFDLVAGLAEHLPVTNDNAADAVPAGFGVAFASQ
jgi:hypothetical protein